MDHKFEMVLSRPHPIDDPRMFVVRTFGELSEGKLGAFKGCSLFGATREKGANNKIRVFFQVDSTEEIITSAWLKDFFAFWLAEMNPDDDTYAVTVDLLMPFGLESTRGGVRNMTKTVDNILTRTSASLVRDPITIKDHKPITITTKRR